MRAQRESFDVIGKVGFGQDFQASKDIDNPVNTFRLMTDNMEEGIRRIFDPFRKYSRGKVLPAWLLISRCLTLCMADRTCSILSPLQVVSMQQGAFC